MEEPGFVSDIYLPQMLYAVTIRSPVAKGRLVSVECPSIPGGCTLITAADIPGKNCLGDSDLPILAGEELSYIGEPVALLLGPVKNTLEDCSKTCKVNVREETPVFSVHEAREDMIAAKREICIGDPDAAFANAASIVSGSYSTGVQEQWYAEPIGAVARPVQADTKKGKNAAVVVCTATQWPFHVKRSVAQVLGITDSSVNVQPALTGLHMDGKLWYPSFISCHAALGAWITQKPVRLILTRGEDFCFSPKRCSTYITIKTALDDKGKILGNHVDATVNLGAIGVNQSEHLDNVYLGCLGVYQTRNIRFSGVALKTNIPPQGPFAGFGLSEGLFAMERQASHIADSAGKDPVLWRNENFFGTGRLLLDRGIKEKTSGDQLISDVVRMSDYYRKWASYELLKHSRRVREKWAQTGESFRGIGIAVAYQGSGLVHPATDRGGCSIELILDKEGSLEIRTSMVNSGCDYKKIWAGIASEILGVDPEMVRINRDGDYPDAGPSTVSRNITVITGLVEQACLAIRKKRFRDPLPITVRKTLRTARLPEAGNEMDLSGFARPGWAAAVVEVEIDSIEYIPKIRGVWMNVNGGKIISEVDARRSLKNSIVQALGWSYREQIGYVRGAIPPEQFYNFDIPGSSEIPPIAIDFIQKNQDEPRGIGDLPFGCVPAAYLQAVSQAMDHHFSSIPLRPQDIWFALIRKRKEDGAA